MLLHVLSSAVRRAMQKAHQAYPGLGEAEVRDEVQRTREFHLADAGIARL